MAPKKEAEPDVTYTKIPNSILKSVFYRGFLTPKQLRLVSITFGETYWKDNYNGSGWTVRPLRVKDFANLSGQSLSNVTPALKDLINLNVLSSKPGKGKSKYYRVNEPKYWYISKLPDKRKDKVIKTITFE